MAAAFIKALNAKIRANPTSNFICSTHFWGPISNFGIPVAAILDMKKSPELISGQMTGALTVYAFTFMRYSLAISPRNYLLFMVHAINACSQVTQGYRYIDYHYWGGKQKMDATSVVDAVKDKMAKVEEKAKVVVSA